MSTEATATTETPKDTQPVPTASTKQAGGTPKKNSQQAKSKNSKPAKKTNALGSGPHRLETSWSFWHSQKTKQATSPFETGLTRLATCNTVEEFWSFYSHMKRPQELPTDTNIHLFRDTTPPMWEQFPQGGSWVVRMKKHSGLLARMWEELVRTYLCPFSQIKLIATIGEVFEEPDLVGVVLRIRKKEDSLVLWNKDHNLRYRIGEKLKQILVLPANCPGMEYQTNRHNILLDQRTSGGKQQQTQTQQGQQKEQKDHH